MSLVAEAARLEASKFRKDARMGTVNLGASESLPDEVFGKRKEATPGTFWAFFFAASRSVPSWLG
jgi:hypothetical protein